MNEPFILDSTPKGNAILAYGETSRPKTYKKLLYAILIGLAVFGCMAFFVKTLFMATIPVPTQTIALAYLSGSSALPSSSPRIWTEAQQQAHGLPFFVGFDTTDQNDIRPFAITLRNIFAKPSVTSWIWQLRQDDQRPAQNRSPRSLVSSWGEYAAPAWLRIWPDQLHLAFSNGDQTSFGGVLANRHWKTDLTSPKSPLQPAHIFGQNFINLSTLPVVLPTLDLAQAATPTAVYWSVDTNDQISLRVESDHPFDLNTKAAFAGAAGIFDEEPYTLPDGTVMNERKPPIKTIQQSTSTVWELKDQRQLTISDTVIALGHTEPLQKELAVPQSCQGSIIAAFDTETLAELLETLGVKTISSLQPLVFLQDNDHVTLCW